MNLKLVQKSQEDNMKASQILNYRQKEMNYYMKDVTVYPTGEHNASFRDMRQKEATQNFRKVKKYI